MPAATCTLPPASVAEDPHYSSRPAVLAALRDAAGERVEQVPAGTLLLEAWRVPGC